MCVYGCGYALREFPSSVQNREYDVKRPVTYGVVAGNRELGGVSLFRNEGGLGAGTEACQSCLGKTFS